MDPNLQKKMYRSSNPVIFNRRLTPYLSATVGATPGNLSVPSSSAMIALHGTPLYNQTKNISKAVAAAPTDIITVPKSEINNSQQGFGVKLNESTDQNTESDTDSDIDTNSVKQVDPAVLSAFEKPTMKTKTATFTPNKGVSDLQNNSTGFNSINVFIIVNHF